MNKLILALFAIPMLALSQGATNDYIFYQKPATGPLVPRAVTPTVGRLMGWPTSISAPASITLGTGLSLSGSTLNSTASSAWGDLTGVPAAITTLSSATAAGLALMDDANASAQRTTLGLGTAATATLATSITGGQVPTIHSGGGLPTLAVAGFSTTGALFYFTPTGTGTPVWNNGPTLSGQVKIGAGTYSFSTLQFYDSNGSGGDNFIALRAPDYVTTDTTFILPAADGTNGQALVTNGSGTLSFATISSGATLAANTYTGLQQFSGTTHAGLRLNNLTTAERDALSSPAAGMAVWNTTDGRLQLHNGSAWTSGMVRLSGDAMTGALSVTLSALGTTTTAGSSLINSTAAAAGAQQVSPALLLRGNGWKTTATAASQTVDFYQDVLPVQGSTAPTGSWRLRSSINGGAAVSVMEVDSVGALYLPNGAAGAAGKVLQYTSGVVELAPGITTRLSGTSLIGIVYPGNSSSAGSFQSDGTGNIAMRGGYDPSVAQELSIYKVDSGANDELAKIGWRSTTDVFTIETSKTGTGTARPLVIRTDGTERLRANASGVTIGASGTATPLIKHGTAVLVAGTVTVSDTDVVAGSRIFINRQTDGGTIGDSYSITRSAGVSFTITSKTANATVTGDTSTLSYLIINP